MKPYRIDEKGEHIPGNFFLLKKYKVVGVALIEQSGANRLKVMP